MSDDAIGRAATSDARDRFRRVDAIFDAALDLPTNDRAAYVAGACAADDALRADVDRLLRAHARAGADGFLADAAAVAGPLLGDAFAPSAGSDGTVTLARVQHALGPAYRLERCIAAGGMATVYLAQDVRHDRPVAVKVLDPELGATLGTPGGAERFLSEIRVTARLQHPNLLPLFDSGAAEGLLYYVMPYVERETLRQRLAREAPLPVDEAVRLATTVAGALAHAHAQGVIHRDLKPENILLQAGQPMVADFGIALLTTHVAGGRLTRSGVAVGTPRYMAPEQARGAATIDERVDVYALGALLYEMLTGDPPHAASTPQVLLAKLLAERPTGVRVLRPAVPEHVAAAVERALEKIPADRFATMDAFVEALRGPALPPSGLRARTVRAATVVATLAVLVSGAAIGWRRTRAAVLPQPTTRFIVAPIADAAIGRAPTITPDGARLVYPGSAGSERRLFVRAVGDLRARALPGTEGALSGFVSPDGRWVGFLTSDDKLKTVPIDGGVTNVLAGAFRYSTATWGRHDRIVLAAYGRDGGLLWMPAAGGALRPLTRLDPAGRELRHSAPMMLDDGATVVFTVERDHDGPVATTGELAVATLDPDAAAPDRHTRLGVRGRGAIGVVAGWLLYTGLEGRTVMAARFDAARRRVTGVPISVLEDPVGGIIVAALARNGTLLYTREAEANAPVLVDPDGTPRPLLADVRGAFMNPRLSPDGRRLAIQGESPQGTDVWVYDLASGTPTRLTTSGNAIGPTWTPDGRRLVFLSSRGGRTAFWWQPVDGSAPAERLVEAEGIFGASVSSDGRTLLFQRQVRGTWGVWSARLDGDRTARPVVEEAFDNYMPALSPDGRWLAYAANPSGRFEIYVRPYPGPGVPMRVSHDGGSEPAWSRDGRQLFFRGDGQMLAATITTRPSLAATRRLLFSEAFDGDMPMPHRNYDVRRDGRGFVMIGSARSAGTETIVVLDWLTELRARIAKVP